MKNEILSLIQNNDGTINTHFKKILKAHKDIYDKILLYYDDSTSLTEAVYRIINNCLKELAVDTFKLYDNMY